MGFIVKGYKNIILDHVPTNIFLTDVILNFNTAFYKKGKHFLLLLKYSIILMLN